MIVGSLLDVQFGPVILFGAGKIPRVMGDVAKGIKNFKAGLKDEETTPAVTTNNDQKAS